MNTLAFHYALFPLPHIAVSLLRSPHANSVPFTLPPLAGIELSVRPAKLSLPFFFIVIKIAVILTVLVYLDSLHLHAFLPLSLECVVVSYLYPHSLPDALVELPEV